MNVRHELNEILATLGLPALDFDAHGCARLLFRESVAVNFELDALSGLLYLYTDLGPLTPNAPVSLYRRLLEANLFGVETHGATLALDRNQNQAVLFKTVHAQSLTLSSFSRLLSGLVDGASHWRKVLSETTGHAEPAGEGLVEPTSPRRFGVATNPGPSR